MKREYWVIFDYDDTLGGVEIDGQIVGNSAAYFKAIDKFVEIVKEDTGVDVEIIKAVQNSIDHLLCNIHGFNSKTRFAESLVTSYEVLTAGNPPSDGELKNIIIHNIGTGVWSHPYVLLPGAKEVLQRVSKHYNVAIVTKGNVEEQSKKIVESGALPFIDRVFVVNHKDEKDWQDVVSSLWIGDDVFDNSWVIGNSPKGDVNLPMSLFGFSGILVSEYGTWSYEDHPVKDGAIEVINIFDVLDVLPLINKGE
jgi:FMN phosphatase YigB (HAD superfamily)